MNRMFQVFAASTVVLLFASAADAAPLRMLLERDTDAAAGSEVFLASFDTFEDLLAGTTSQTGFSQVDINSNFSVGGLAYDGVYRALLERDTDAAAGSEVFLASFDTFEDLLAGTTSQTGFSQVDINSNFSVGGLAYEAPNNNGGPAVIPLPAGGLLLLSALASAFAFRRKDKLLR